MIWDLDLGDSPFPQLSWLFFSALKWHYSLSRLSHPFLSEESFEQVHSGWLLWAFPSQHHKEWEELSPDSPHPLGESLMKFLERKTCKRSGILLSLWPQELLTLRRSGVSRNFISLSVHITSGGFCPRYPNVQALCLAEDDTSIDFKVAVCSVISISLKGWWKVNLFVHLFSYWKYGSCLFVALYISKLKLKVCAVLWKTSIHKFLFS